MKTAYRKWIKDRLRYFRELKNKTQSEMARLLEIKLCTYQSYEEGRATPGIFTLKKFCKVCRIKIDHFLKGSPDQAHTSY